MTHQFLELPKLPSHRTPIKFAPRTLLLIMGFNPVFGSFAVIAVVTLVQCTEYSYILAGEDTPVWTAHCSHAECNNQDKLVTYIRLEKGAVKRAIDYMKYDTFKSLTYLPKRPARSIEDFENHQDEPGYNGSELESLASNGNRSKHAGVYNYGILQVYTLLVLDYDTSDLTDDVSRGKFINEKILYVLAYWNSFNNIVATNKRTNNWSKVNVNIVGIVINLDRAATPYLKSSLSAQDALKLSNDYWSTPPHADFTPRNAYHVVITMTDSRKAAHVNGYFESVVMGRRDSSGSIIVWDSVAFRAVRYSASISYFQQAVNSLHYWALHDPHLPEHMKPGKIVESVLPGILMTPEQQCVSHGYRDLERVCPEYSVSCEIFCEYKYWSNIIKNNCRSIGKALEGTPCVDGKVL